MKKTRFERVQSAVQSTFAQVKICKSTTLYLSSSLALIRSGDDYVKLTRYEKGFIEGIIKTLDNHLMHGNELEFKYLLYGKHIKHGSKASDRVHKILNTNKDVICAFFWKGSDRNFTPLNFANRGSIDGKSVPYFCPFVG